MPANLVETRDDHRRRVALAHSQCRVVPGKRAKDGCGRLLRGPCPLAGFGLQGLLHGFAFAPCPRLGLALRLLLFGFFVPPLLLFGARARLGSGVRMPMASALRGR
ncbi:hypothetical protein GSI_07222 [Ganoderma sinense ZZ0214-1]|uniref:Uncharacterized protein n=1 Tax=Ganoderma sinense ZZ0214-1 TaxID=1077348 RepID=A0A2G8S9T4_9APHY|nr:hypothetical protein GSI_07222 [Ganoderma sinense ZZ0214-1]